MGDNTRNRLRKPRKGTKSEAILTLTTLTPATPVEIAESVNASRSLVCQVMKRYGIIPNQAESFKQHRADVLAGLQDKLLSSVSDEEIKKTPVGTRILGACQLYDKERLERDLSTANVASIHADIAALRKQDNDLSTGDKR